MFVTDKIFLFTAQLMTAPIYVKRIKDIEGIYSLFSENLMVFMALKISFSN